MKLFRIILITLSLLLGSCSSSAPPQPPVLPPVSTPSPAPPNIPPSPISTPTPPPVKTLSSTTNLTVHFINVGQGDSILIDLGETEILIDGGEKSPGVLSYLRAYVDGCLDVMIATHSDGDHIGGLIDVLANYQVSEIWMNGDAPNTALSNQFMNLVIAEGASVYVADRGNTIQAGLMKFNILNPGKILFSDDNNNSIVLSLSYGDTDFLFMGDAEKEAEAQMLAQSIVPDVEILKVGHHASSTSSSASFLSQAKPDVAIYSAALGNMYRFPTQAALLALDGVGAKIYGTDVHWTVTVSTNGTGYNVQTQKTAPLVKPTNALPNPAPNPAPTPNASVNVKITKIFYDGLVPTTESDEYVEITNLGSGPVDLKGWKLQDVADGTPTFTFPSYVLQSGASIRVYTNEIHPEYGGFSFGRGTLFGITQALILQHCLTPRVRKSHD